MSLNCLVTNYGMKSCGLDGRTFQPTIKSKLELQTYGLLHTRNFSYHVLAFRTLLITMTNEEIKANELIHKMKTKLYSDGLYDAKQCALVAVDEILSNIDATILYNKESIALPINKEYWQNVRSFLV